MLTGHTVAIYHHVKTGINTMRRTQLKSNFLKLLVCVLLVQSDHVRLIIHASSVVQRRRQHQSHLSYTQSLLAHNALLLRHALEQTNATTLALEGVGDLRLSRLVLALGSRRVDW